MDIEEIAQAILQARNESAGKDIKSRSKDLYMILGMTADKRKYNLKLRK